MIKVGKLQLKEQSEPFLAMPAMGREKGTIIKS